MNEGTCRSCGKRILWIQTRAGRSMPCDAQPINYQINPDSSTKLVTPAGDVVSCDVVKDPADVMVLASNIVNTQQAEYSDDGITQQAVIKTGITTKEKALVPNPVNLIPYRTFLEVDQPASDFIFRITEGRGGAPTFKLVAADGGLWKSQAVENVKAYLTEKLADIPDRNRLTILA